MTFFVGKEDAMKRLVILFALTALAAQVQCCGGTNGKTAAPKKKSAPKIAVDKEVRFVEDEDLEGLRMVLREAGAPSQDTEAVSLAKGKALEARQKVSSLLRSIGKTSWGRRWPPWR